MDAGIAHSLADVLQEHVGPSSPGACAGIVGAALVEIAKSLLSDWSTHVQQGCSIMAARWASMQQLQRGTGGLPTAHVSLMQYDQDTHDGGRCGAVVNFISWNDPATWFGQPVFLDEDGRLKFSVHAAHPCRFLKNPVVVHPDCEVQAPRKQSVQRPADVRPLVNADFPKLKKMWETSLVNKDSVGSSVSTCLWCNQRIPTPTSSVSAAPSSSSSSTDPCPTNVEQVQRENRTVR